jgi:hypothetical protein
MTIALVFAAGLAFGPVAQAQNCGALPNTLTNGTLADATQVMANFNQLLTCINALVPAGGSGIRQVMTSGPATTAGLPNILPTTTASLTLTSVNLSATTPLTVTAANGFDPATGKQRDVVGYSASNLSWSLAANTAYYLYVTVAANGTLTTGFTTREPIYQAAGTPSVQNGQFTFNISEMKGYLGNGSLAPQSNAVFVGTATTGATTVASTSTYAYNGRYESLPATPLVTGNWVVANHNIGVKPDVYDFIIENIATDQNYAPGDILHADSLAGDYGGTALPLAITANKGAATFVAGSSTFYITSDKYGTSRVTLNPMNWRYRYVIRRGW